MKDTINKGIDYYIDYRLRAWGYWYAKVLTHGLGYPSKSISGRIRDDGGIVSRSTAPAQAPANPQAEEIDNLINEIGRKYPAFSDAIKIHYTHSNFRSVLKQRGISLTTHKTNLRIAKILLSEKLDNQS